MSGESFMKPEAIAPKVDEEALPLLLQARLRLLPPFFFLLVLCISSHVLHVSGLR
jgi:hypothetical protein